jgi:hypothetical protein
MTPLFMSYTAYLCWIYAGLYFLREKLDFRNDLANAIVDELSYCFKLTIACGPIRREIWHVLIEFLVHTVP